MFTPVDTHIAGERLNVRTNYGLTVELLWERKSDRTFVRVEDWSNRSRPVTFEVPGERAADAFRHPYAYMAEPVR